MLSGESIRAMKIIVIVINRCNDKKHGNHKE
jgi:hypothetical protein